MNAVYHDYATCTDTIDDVGPYDYIVRPPIGRLLAAIQDHCGVGGTIRPGVRQLAQWMNYASAGRVAPLLAQLVTDGRILYDGANGCITLLADPTDDVDDDAITASDRVVDHDGAAPATHDVFGHYDADHDGRSLDVIDRPHMVDHDLTAAGDRKNPVVVKYKLPCADETITIRDRPPPDVDTIAPSASPQTTMVVDDVDALLYSLGADRAIVVDAARHEWTVDEVQARHTYDLARMAKNDRMTIGVFFHAIRHGHRAPRSSRGLVPADYAGRSDFVLGSAPPEVDAPGTIRDRAERIMPPITPATIRTAQRDLEFVMHRMGMGDSDDEARAALAARMRGEQR